MRCRGGLVPYGVVGPSPAVFWRRAGNFALVRASPFGAGVNRVCRSWSDLGRVSVVAFSSSVARVVSLM
eukprot:14545321-Alexandrium_andersonii.AAC.1